MELEPMLGVEIFQIKPAKLGIPVTQILVMHLQACIDLPLYSYACATPVQDADHACEQCQLLPPACQTCIRMSDSLHHSLCLHVYLAIT